MNETPRSNRGWRILRRVLICTGILATLVAIFYTEENWRGKRAWENCQRALEVQGETLDWNKFIPPVVPDEQNFFSAVKMQDWFVRPHGQTTTNELVEQLQEGKFGTLSASVSLKTNLIQTAESAKDYLSQSEQFKTDVELVREALKRPYARIDGDYSQPFEIPLPNFIAMRAVVQLLAQRAHCYLLLGQPDKALDELTLLNNFRRVLEFPPSGKTTTLVSAMINVAVAKLYTDEIAEGFHLKMWYESQLSTLQQQLALIDLPPFVVAALKSEPVGVCYTIEAVQMEKMLADKGFKWTPSFTPGGWIYQNMVNVVELDRMPLKGIDCLHNTIFPRIINDSANFLDDFFRHDSFTKKLSLPFKMLAAISVPDFSKAIQTAAYNQTLVNEAQIACALERYKIAIGSYPETLDALSPQFIAQLPHDIIGGQPLKYQRKADGKFLLYSIGWDEKDDDGMDYSLFKSDKGFFAEGDWVWQQQAK